MNGNRVLLVTKDSTLAAGLASRVEEMVVFSDEMLPSTEYLFQTFRHKGILTFPIISVDVGEAIKTHDLNAVVIDRDYFRAVYLFPIFWVANIQTILITDQTPSKWLRWAKLLTDRHVTHANDQQALLTTLVDQLSSLPRIV